MSNQFPYNPNNGQGQPPYGVPQQNGPSYQNPGQGFPPQQPAYAQQQPSYQQPQYQTPQGNNYPGPPAPVAEQTRTMAIVGMILAIIVPLAGAIVSGFTWKKAARLGERTTLPKIGTIVGSVLTVLSAISTTFLVLALIAAGGSFNTYLHGQQPDEEAYVAYVKSAATASGMTWDDATTPEIAIDAGNSVCDELDYGTSYEDVYKLMTTDLVNPKAAPLYAAVTEGAVKYLCPEYAQ